MGAAMMIDARVGITEKQRIEILFIEAALERKEQIERGKTFSNYVIESIVMNRYRDDNEPVVLITLKSPAKPDIEFWLSPFDAGAYGIKFTTTEPDRWHDTKKKS